jgi:hypothetical protein
MVAVAAGDRFARLGDQAPEDRRVSSFAASRYLQGMRPLLLVVLGTLALGAGSAARAGSARVENPAQRVVLHLNDRFAVAGSKIGCRVVRRSRHVSDRLHCFLETGSDSFVPKPASYEVELAAQGVVVVRVGRPDHVVFNRREIRPKGIPRGGRKATRSFGRVVRLHNRFDKVYLVTTNIVCRPFGSRPPLGLLCVLLGADGHVPDGTYLVLLTPRGISVALARNGKPVTVFSRMHGR